MNEGKTRLENALRAYVQGLDKPFFEDVRRTLDAQLESLASEGLLGLGPDHQLTGQALEIRVRQIFQQLGFSVQDGRPGQEDFILTTPENVSPNRPIVLEVKSSRQPQLKREDLRQLDDWVYDLSGEEQARKHGLGGGSDPLAIWTAGLVSESHSHPSPHRGVMVFNAPIGVLFENRLSDSIGQNDIEFILKRNFCILPFQILVMLSEMHREHHMTTVEVWGQLHSTQGLFRLPSN